MADPVSITFKMDTSLADAIIRRAGELDVTRSELLRNGIEFWLALLAEHPQLIEADKKRLTHLGGKIGKIVEILEN